MATDVERLIVSLEATTKKFERALNKAMGTADKSAKRIESRFARMNKHVTRTFAGMGRGLVAGLAAGFTIREFKNLSDAATRIENSLKVAGLAGADLERVYNQLRAAAIKNGAPLETLAELYSRAAMAAGNLGASQEDLSRFSENVALSLRVSGKSATEAAGALLQLSQLLSGNVVQAQEYNSLIDGAYPLLQAVAAGLKEAGGDVGKLTQLVKAGKVPTQAFFQAFQAGAPILEEKISGAEYTISQAMENLRTALTNAAREFNKTTGASQSFADGINTVADAIDSFDTDGFVDSIGDARDALEDFLGRIGNAAFLKNLNIKLGITDENGNLINLETKEAENKAAALEREIELLQATIAKNTELGFDNTEAIDRLNEVRGTLAQLRAEMANMPATMPDPIALKSRDTAIMATERARRRALGGGQKPIKPVSLSDFDPPPPSGGTGGGGGGGGGRRRKDDFQRETEQIEERTAALQAETQALSGLNPLIDDYDFAVTKAKASAELLTAAQQAGLAITPELRANIDALAESYATATAESNRLAESQDKARQNAQEMRDLGKDVLGGFIRDLQAGKSASEALANALQKVADKLLDVALNSLFDGGGGLGGIFGAIGGIFGFAKGGIAARGRPYGPPLKRFARGGVSNTAAVFGEAGPEAAVPLPDGRSIPVTLKTPQVPQGKPVNETVRIVLQDDSGRMADIADQRIQTAAGTIVQISVQQSQKATKQNFSDYLANSQVRKM